MVTGQLRGSNTKNLCELITRTFSLSTVKFDINRQISTSIDKFKLSGLKIHYCYIFLLFYRLIEEDGNKADGRKKEAIHFF